MCTIPYTPEEVSEKYLERIPNSLIAAVNELLVEKGYLLLTARTKDKGIAIATSIIIERAIKTDSSVAQQVLIDNDFFDLENLYAQYGWDVSRHSPKSGEDYPDHYQFKRILKPKHQNP